MLYNKSKILIEHIHYKNNINFEEMITIYKNKKDTNPKPIFVFLMGSAWLGHIPFLYFITNYWNSSIMKNLSNKGYTCISIRHRGTFFSPIYLKTKYLLFSPSLIAFIIVGSFGVVFEGFTQLVFWIYIYIENNFRLASS